MGQRRMFFREAEDQAATRKNWERQSAHPPVCAHTFPLLPAHCGEEEEKEGGW